MKTYRGSGIFNFTKYVLFFLIIIVLSCTSTSLMRLEGNDFEKNLPGLWEGKWYWGSGARSNSGKEYIKIIKIDENKVHLTGYAKGTGGYPATDEVYGRIENSTLLLTWPKGGTSGIEEKYTMKRDDSNNLILDGSWRGELADGKVQLKKIE